MEHYLNSIQRFIKTALIPPFTKNIASKTNQKRIAPAFLLPLKEIKGYNQQE